MKKCAQEKYFCQVFQFGTNIALYVKAQKWDCIFLREAISNSCVTDISNFGLFYSCQKNQLELYKTSWKAPYNWSEGYQNAKGTVWSLWNCQKVNSSYSALKPLPRLPNVPKVAYLWDILIFQAPVTFRFTGESHGSFLQLEYIGQHWRNLMKIHTLWLSSCLTSAWEWSGQLLGDIGNHFRCLRVFGSVLGYNWGVKMSNGILRGPVLVHFLQFSSAVSSHI